MTLNPFERDPHGYDAARPSYPSRAIDFIESLLPHTRVNHSQSRTPISLADIGAGSGKMSILLARRGYAVHAVEPSAPMRHQLEEALAGFLREGAGQEKDARFPCGLPLPVRIVEGRAEATGLPAQSVAGIVSAQAWHWFDGVKAGEECARIALSDAPLIIVFNQLRVSIPWVLRLTRIMRSGDVHRIEKAPIVGNYWQEPKVQVFPWEHVVSAQEIEALAATRSSYLRADEKGRAHMRENLHWYLYEYVGFSSHTRIRLPYETLVWYAYRKE